MAKSISISSKLLTGKGKLLVALLVFLLLAFAPLVLSDFRTNLLGKFICFAIVALGLDMIWGYTGILSLGHGVFFGLGAYCMAMFLKLEASGGGLVDFMKWSGLESLPAFWVPFQNPIFALAMVIIVPTLFAAIIGFATFKNRIKGVYFSILSQAIAIIVPTLIIGQQAYTGGTNGLTGFSTIFGHRIASTDTKLALYYASLVALILAFALCYFLVNKRVGKILIAIRDGENRARFSGFNPTTYKLFVYCLSAALAGVAGALYVPQVGIISPNEMGIVFSIEMIIWVAIGGKGTLIGALIGTFIICWSKTFISESFPDIWSYFIGLVFIFVILYMPKGIVGVVDTIKEKREVLRLKAQNKTTTTANDGTAILQKAN